MGAYRYVFYMTGILGITAGLLQVYNALVSGVFLVLLYRHHFPTCRRRVAICSNDFSAAAREQDIDFPSVVVRRSNLNQRLHCSDRLFEFQKSSQLFIGTHSNTLTVVAMRVSNPKRFRLLNAE